MNVESWNVCVLKNLLSVLCMVSIFVHVLEQDIELLVDVLHEVCDNWDRVIYIILCADNVCILHIICTHYVCSANYDISNVANDCARITTYYLSSCFFLPTDYGRISVNSWKIVTL